MANFLTYKFKAMAVGAVAAMALIMSAPAQAVTVNVNPGDSNTIVPGNLYVAQTQDRAYADGAFSDSYTFYLPDYVPVDGQQTVQFSGHVIDLNTVAFHGIGNLLFEIVSGSTTYFSQQLTDANSQEFVAGVTSVLTNLLLPAPLTFDVVISGTPLENNGSYSFSISAVPLPPAFLLLGSGLVGLGFLSRRKTRKGAETAAA